MIDLYYKLDENRNKTNGINMAHATNENASLRFYEQPLAPFLKTIKEWLDSHPDDIITLHLESYIRNYDFLIKNINDAGLIDRLFNLDSGARWPTLGWMRKNNKRLVVFSDKREDAGYGIMYVLDTMETQYDIDEFPNCEKRSEGRAKKSTIFIMNHFYKFSMIPGATKAAAVLKSLYSITIDKSVDLTLINQNQYKYLVQRAGTCFFQEGQWPNFIAVDFIGAIGGDERKITLDINGNNCCCPEASEGNNIKTEAGYSDNSMNKSSNSATVASSKIDYIDQRINQDYYNDDLWQNTTGKWCPFIKYVAKNQQEAGSPQICQH